jgi:DNA primase
MRNGRAIAAALGGKRIRGGFRFLCPCHQDRVPSAAIRESDGLITCFAGCDRRAVAAALDQLGFQANEP